MSWIDLHLHSCYSDDGEFTPLELIERCRKAAVRTVALADHNTTAGVRQAQIHAVRNGITLIPGIELDCTFGEVNLHVLGYFIDPEYAPFEEIGADILAQEQKAASERIRRVKETGIYVDEDKVMRRAINGVVPGELIAEVALEDERNHANPHMAPYLPGGAFADSPLIHFYWNLCAKGKPAYVTLKFITLQQAVEHIHKAGGIAVLAHPGNNIHEDEALLRGIVDAGVCGIEVFSSYHSAEQTAFYRDQADRMDLAVTCGSDFHGKTKPTIEVGSVECDSQEHRWLKGLYARRGLGR
ncbi:MAG: PHP domain-containing protein [Lachnospiraceae bacterium]